MPSIRSKAMSHPALAAVLAAALVAGAAACTDILGPGIPSGAQSLTPVPAQYHGWWGLVERCSELHGDLDVIDWNVLPGESRIPGEGDAVGAYYTGSQSVILADGKVRDGFVVRHEMLHALLDQRGYAARHLRAFFMDRCGGIVDCSAACAEEAGPPPAGLLDAPSADPDQLEVTAEVVPSLVYRSRGTRGCVSIVVGVRNVADRPVRIDVGEATAFEWGVVGIGGGGGGNPIPVEDTVLLEPGQVRRQAFDCPQRIKSAPPGEYRGYGTFQHMRSDSVLFTILP